MIPDVTNGQALNAYAYVYNDPINLVDPSGNIPSLPTRQDVRDTTRRGFEKGLDFLHWWNSVPDDCECKQNPPSIIDLTQKINLGANLLAHVAWGKSATPAFLNAAVVGTYESAPLPSQYRVFGNSGHRLVGVETNVNVTGWFKQGHAVELELLDVYSGQGASLLESNGGKTIKYLRNVTVESTNAFNGFAGSILGAGLIDAAFQLLGDWAKGLCLSPADYALRAIIALEFGLLAGVFGAAFAVFAVYFGASVGVATAVSIGAGLAASWALTGLKNHYLNAVE